MTLILCFHYRSPWQPHPLYHAQHGEFSGQHRHKDTMTQFWVNIKSRRHEVEAVIRDGFTVFLAVVQVACACGFS